MAKLSTLVLELARAVGVTEQRCFQCARHLRENGLISQHGRGPYAADMTETDAVNLLLGLLTSDQLKDAPHNVELARSAEYIGMEVNYDGKVCVDNPPVRFMNDEGRPRDFGEALDYMLVHIANFQALLRDNGLPVEDFNVSVTRPGLRSTIEIMGNPHLLIHFEAPDPRLEGLTGDARLLRSAELRPGRVMEVTATIHRGTIWEIGSMLGYDHDG